MSQTRSARKGTPMVAAVGIIGFIGVTILLLLSGIYINQQEQEIKRVEKKIQVIDASGEQFFGMTFYCDIKGSDPRLYFVDNFWVDKETLFIQLRIIGGTYQNISVYFVKASYDLLEKKISEPYVEGDREYRQDIYLFFIGLVQHNEPFSITNYYFHIDEAFCYLWYSTNWENTTTNIYQDGVLLLENIPELLEVSWFAIEDGELHLVELWLNRANATEIGYFSLEYVIGED